MVSQHLFTALIALTALERLFEVRLSKRNAEWSFAQGGIEIGAEHYPFMVVLHTGFLFAMVGEVYGMDRSFSLVWGSLWFGVALACQGLRWWCITTLGHRWNTRVILVPNLPRITNGPYRYFSHPNYMVVVMEGIALPMVHNAWWTALGFTLLNALLLYTRIRCEENALREHCSPYSQS